MNRWTGPGLVLLITSCVFVPGVAEAQTPAPTSPVLREEAWEVVLLQGNRIGYNHSLMREDTVDGQRVLITENLGHMSIKRAGQTLTTSFRLYVEESAPGVLRRFRSTLKNPPHSQTEQQGELRGETLVVSTTTGGQTREQTIPNAAGLKSSVYGEHYLRERDLAEGESIQFDTFDPQLGKQVQITLKRFSPESVQVWSGEIQRLDRVIMTSSGLPGVMTTLYLDPQTKRTVRTTIPLIGIDTYTVTEAEALKEFPAFDQLQASLIPVAGAGDLLQAREAIFQVDVDGSVAPNLFPSGAGQQVVAGGSQLKVTVRPAGPGRTGFSAVSPPPGPEFLESSHCLECQAPLIQQLSREGIAGAKTPTEKALALEQFVRQYITKRNLATALATALEVAQSKSGDCTEHAVLLAALLRAAEIPSRVVTGFVYSPRDKALVGHMWTEAWIEGVWQPLDATRAEGGTRCGHLKLSDSPLSGGGTAAAAEFIPLVALQGRTRVRITELIPPPGK